MANQQLVDYIKSQLGAGVSEEMVKNALKTAGWPDADVEDGVKAAKPGPANAVAAAPAKISPNQIGVVTAPVEKPAAVGSTGIPAGGIGVGLNAKPADIQPKANVLDIREAISAKDELLNSMNNMAGKEAGKAVGVAAAGPAVSGAANAAGTLSGKSGFFGKISIAEIVMAVIIVALLGGGTWFYLSQSGGASRADSLASQNAALENQIAAMTKTNSELSAESSSLKTENAGLATDVAALKNDLSFYAVIPGISTITENAVNVKGILTLSKSGQYVLTTANGAIVNVKNYKDTKVDALLKPLLGASVELAGTHPAGSRDLTVVSVNGQAVAAASEAAPAVTATP